MEPENRLISHKARAAVALCTLTILILVCCGFFAILQAIFLVLFGWPLYLKRVVPQLNPDPWAVGTAIVCLTGFVFGSHKFLKWLYAVTTAESRAWRWKWTGLLVALVLLMFTAGIAFIGVVHQTSWLVRSPESLFSGNREAVPRIVSSSNLKYMGLATHEYYDANQTLPQVQFNSTGQAMHSWQTLILSYLEQKQIYSQIDIKKPWNDPRNAEPMSQLIKPYLHPNYSYELLNGYGVSHYAPNARVVFGDTPRGLNSFTPETILAGEVSGNFRAWGNPLNTRDPRFGNTGHPQGFGGPNGKPAQFLMLDGSVRTFDPKELDAALHVAR